MLLKPFTDIDITDEEDIKALLYCLSDMSVPFETYKGIFDSPKVAKKEIAELMDCLSVRSQFIEKDKSEGENESTEKTFIKDMIAVLIAEGIDAHYVMEEMELQDIPIFISAVDYKHKETMERERLFTFLGMTPHIDVSKLPNGEKDILPFPWEKKKADTAITEEEYDRIMEQLKKKHNGTA